MKEKKIGWRKWRGGKIDFYERKIIMTINTSHLISLTGIGSITPTFHVNAMPTIAKCLSGEERASGCEWSAKNVLPIR